MLHCSILIKSSIPSLTLLQWPPGSSGPETCLQPQDSSESTLEGSTAPPSLTYSLAHFTGCFHVVQSPETSLEICFLLPCGQKRNITNNKTQTQPSGAWPLMGSDFHLEELLEFSPLLLMPRGKRTKIALVFSVQEARWTSKLQGPPAFQGYLDCTLTRTT